MKDNVEKWYGLDFFVYAFFAVFSLCTVLYLFYFDPVNYSLLVAEDHVAEYSTAACYALAGIILIAMTFRDGPKIRKAMWLLIGLVALLIAAEEISWGQRIFSVATPTFLSENNIQKEVTLHNLVVFDSVHKKLHDSVSYLILVYLVFSQIVLTSMPRLRVKLTASGVPLIQLKLVPIFLLVPFFLLVYPTARADEVGELFLGVAVLFWAVTLLTDFTQSKRFGDYTAVFTMAGVLLLAVVISGGVSYKQAPEQRRNLMLNKLASWHYYNKKMYKQAEAIYSYIYQNPQYLAIRTRINHGELLQAAGKHAEAEEILLIAARNIKAKSDLQKPLSSNHLRLLGSIYTLLLDNNLAENYFEKSIAVDEKKLLLRLLPDDAAETLWSIAQTMEAMGDTKNAAIKLKQAIKYAPSAVLLHKLELQLKQLESL